MINKPAESLSFSSRHLQREEMRKNPPTTNPSPTQEAKNTILVPWLVDRLALMQKEGLPIPEHWLDPKAELLRGVEVEIDPSMEPDGEYFFQKLKIFLKKEPSMLSGEAQTQSPWHNLVHEMVHFISGIDLRPRSDMQHIKPVRWAGFAEPGLDFAGRKLLFEATTEALTRWIVSNENADFNTMDAKTFFEGPADIPMQNYTSDQHVMAIILEDMPSELLLKAYFADTITINGQAIPNADYEAFERHLNSRVRGGFGGLSHLALETTTRSRLFRLSDEYGKDIKTIDGFLPAQDPSESLLANPLKYVSLNLKQRTAKRLADDMFDELVTNWENDPSNIVVPKAATQSVNDTNEQPLEGDYNHDQSPRLDHDREPNIARGFQISASADRELTVGPDIDVVLQPTSTSPFASREL